MWAVLQQNYPNAFQKVDKTDPGGVWAANLDDLMSRQMIPGLKALQRHDERYMPNAPTCRKIIVEAATERERQRKPEPPSEPERDPVELMFVRLRGYLWQDYVKAMILKRGAEITDRHAAECWRVAEHECRPFEESWRDEPEKNKENWQWISVTAANTLFKAWQAIIKAKNPILRYDILYPKK